MTLLSQDFLKRTKGMRNEIELVLSEMFMTKEVGIFHVFYVAYRRLRFDFLGRG